MSLTFITGNQNKADYLEKLLGLPLNHQKIDLSEIQSLDLEEIVRHKASSAFEIVKTPVLVEDVGLEFTALGRLPGPFIKWFIDDLGLEGLCRLLDGKDRGCVARCVFGYFDGKTEAYFAGECYGSVPKEPAIGHGFGWDPIFIPNGHDVTRGELSRAEEEAVYLKIKPIEAVRLFLQSN